MGGQNMRGRNNFNGKFPKSTNELIASNFFPEQIVAARVPVAVTITTTIDETIVMTVKT